jgi:hypothetical protein
MMYQYMNVYRYMNVYQYTNMYSPEYFRRTYIAPTLIG